jgi:hypothetical protein
MTRSEIHPSAVLDHDVPAPHAAMDVQAPQPDLGGAPPAADLLRNGLDGLLRDLHPTNPTAGEAAQHGAPQQNSRPADESRHDAPRDNSGRGLENAGNQAHQNNAAADHDGRTDGHNAATAGAGHENAQAGASAAQPAFTQANPVATQPSTPAPGPAGC